MSRYIDADNTLKSIDKAIQKYAENEDVLEFISELRYSIIGQPTEDVEKVRRGKWVEGRFGNGITVPYSKYYICNQCNHTSQKKSRYCHYCGARNGR